MSRLVPVRSGRPFNYPVHLSGSGRQRALRPSSHLVRRRFRIWGRLPFVIPYGETRYW